jgi:hypothetical protein
MALSSATMAPSSLFCTGAVLLCVHNKLKSIENLRLKEVKVIKLQPLPLDSSLRQIHQNNLHMRHPIYKTDRIMNRPPKLVNDMLVVTVVLMQFPEPSHLSLML